MKLIKKTFIFITVTALILALTGCSSPKIEKVNVDEVKVYADPSSEKIFTGISEGDYGLFSGDFDEQMANAITEAKFKEIVSQLGKCESGEIIAADRVQGYTRAYYKTKFSKNSKDVTFTIVFSETDNRKVSGLFYR